MSRWFLLFALLWPGNPDFSGTWKLNLDKSDLGPNSPKPERFVMEVRHEVSALSMKTTLTTNQGDRTQEQKVTLDGTETRRELPGGGAVLTRSHWEGRRLVFEQSLDGAMKVAETWSLSPDRKTLTTVRTIGGPQGPVSSRMVFDRLEPKP